MRIDPHERGEFRHAFDQCGEIVAALVAIAGMERGEGGHWVLGKVIALANGELYWYDP